VPDSRKEAEVSESSVHFTGIEDVAEATPDRVARGDLVLSIWPATAAAGLTLLLFGVVGSLAFVAVGGIVSLVAIAGWIREISGE
jgi:hypothetical protein